MEEYLKTKGRIFDIQRFSVHDGPGIRTIVFLRSGGGMTLSGGESLAQPEFAPALLRAAKESGINTAMESTGFAKYEVIQKYLPYLDLYLMDIKHMNSEKHKAFTTQPNELILENAKKIAKDAKKLIIRTPVIPTFNDTVEEIREIARFAKSLGTVEEMHILPYHRLGSDKYSGLGRQYSLSNIEPPPKEHMNRLLEVVKSEGLKGQIGG